jgi:dTMP kinase
MTKSHSKPVFVVFEGLDGSGKTTCAKRTAELLEARYMTTPSEALRSHRDRFVADFGDCQEAAQLFYLATVVAASREVEACLASGLSVVLDRYFLSTQVYAEFRGSKLSIEKGIEQVLHPADITVFLDVPLGVRQARTARRPESSSADQETFDVNADRTLRTAYERRFESPIIGMLVQIDGSRRSAEELAGEVVRQIDRL